ncbi:thermosome subunit, partial [Thermococcus sp. CX2]
VVILPEGTQRYVGRDAQRLNILAARIVAETIRTTLGPKGMDKMLVDSLGDIVITNDGATILDEMDIQHPAAKMMVEVAKTQDKEAGDGTTTAVVIAGELLRKAEELI